MEDVTNIFITEPITPDNTIIFPLSEFAINTNQIQCRNDNVAVVDEIGTISGAVNNQSLSTMDDRIVNDIVILVDTAAAAEIAINTNNMEDAIRNQVEIGENVDGLDNTEKKRVRKRVRNEAKWKCNERKKKHQAGEAYLSKRKKMVPARSVVNSKNCLNNCKFKCSKQISMDMRKALFQSYYKLTHDEKHLYLLQITKRTSKRRTVKKTINNENEVTSRRQYSFAYYFPMAGGSLVRICKQFFLGTLCISQKPIYNAHNAKDVNEVPKKDGRGKSAASRRQVSTELLEDVVTHIKLFPSIDAHYCRCRTQRQYLDANLSVPKMYDLYQSWCNDNEKNPVKLSMYRRIFVTKFNYGFHIPKTDRCEKCENYKIKKSERDITQEEEIDYQSHIAEKEAMRTQKKKDKESKIPILVFDLENVISCPRTEIGPFFYNSKLNVYNLTAYLTTTKTVYCAIWNEAQQGRTGNCLASAFTKILSRVLLDNEIEDLITWSDSCVPQNRNSFISFAILKTLRENNNLHSITMNYSCAGHGAVQEVDSIHSRIENFMKKAEFFSPLGFIRNLKMVNKNHPYVILQMTSNDFKNFEECSLKLEYKKVPFSKVTSLKFTQELNIVQYKTSHIQNNYESANIMCENKINPRRKCVKMRGGGRSIQTRGGFKNINHNIPAVAEATISVLNLIPRTLQPKQEISKDKIAALKRMMGTMPEVDKQYYKALLHIN